MRSPNSSSAGRAIRAAYADMDQAVARRDVARELRHYANDFEGLGPTGMRVTKARHRDARQYAYSRPTYAAGTQTTRVRRVVVHGRSAVVTASREGRVLLRNT